MGFSSAISLDMRSILTSICKQWKGKDIYVAFSGNFTIESILSSIGGFRTVHSHDVTLYSAAVGSYLANDDFHVEVYDRPEYEWLKDWVKPGIDTIATLLLAAKALPCVGRMEPYFERMLNAYQRRWPQLHAATKERIKPILEKIKITSYFSGDVFDFVNSAPDEAVVIAFPSTYAGGDDKSCKLVNKAFYWPMPAFEPFDDERSLDFFHAIMERNNFLISRGACMPEWEHNIVGQVQTSINSKPVYLYSKNRDKVFLKNPRQKLDNVPLDRLGENDDIVSPLKLVPLNHGQFNSLRSQYLSVRIAPAVASVRLAITSGDKLIGALAFDLRNFDINDAYMLTDFAIAPTKYKRLSKLVLAAALSTEVREYLMQAFNQNVLRIFTTAHTTNSVSMKYRGIFDVYDKKETAINYIAKAGRWSLEGGLQWWIQKHSTTKE